VVARFAPLRMSPDGAGKKRVHPVFLRLLIIERSSAWVFVDAPAGKGSRKSRAYIILGFSKSLERQRRSRSRVVVRRRYRVFHVLLTNRVLCSELFYRDGGAIDLVGGSIRRRSPMNVNELERRGRQGDLTTLSCVRRRAALRDRHRRP